MQSPETTEFAPATSARDELKTQNSAHLTRRQFLQTGARVALGGGLVCAATGAYAHTIAPARCTFPETEITVPRLPRAFDNFRVALIADLHLDEEPDTQRLNRLVERVNDWQPDVVTLVGDYISYEAVTIENQLARGLAQLRARDGVWATMGNHDHLNGDGPNREPLTLRRALKTAAVPELCNDFTIIRRGDTQLILAGLDSVAGHPDLDGLQARLPAPRQCTIVMLHEPDYATGTSKRACFDLQLSGHSHGGQVVIPFYGPPILPPSGRIYHTGLYHVPYDSQYGRGEMLQYTTCGAGTSGTRVRLNCPPEISLLKLRAPQGA